MPRSYAPVSRKTTRGAGTRTAKSTPDTAKIRAWVKNINHMVPDRGCIHQIVNDTHYADRRTSRAADLATTLNPYVYGHWVGSQTVNQLRTAIADARHKRATRKLIQ